MERFFLSVGRESAAGIVGRKVEGLNSKERRVGHRTRGKLSPDRAAKAGAGRGYADRAGVSAHAGRSASLPPQPRRGLLCRAAARPTKLGPEPAADAYQQRRRSLSAHAAGAGSTAYPGTVRGGL